MDDWSPMEGYGVKTVEADESRCIAVVFGCTGDSSGGSGASGSPRKPHSKVTGLCELMRFFSEPSISTMLNRTL